jgi:hemolysin activation/secretion protein
LALTGQYAFNLLPSSEEFSVGGELFGRAYDAGEIVGSSGFAGKLELRYGGTTAWPFLRKYTLYGLYEGGKVWRVREPLFDRSLASAGLGVRTDFAKGLAGYLEVNRPLTKVVLQEQNKDDRVFAGISWAY